MKTTHLVVAVVLLVGGGVVHGMWTHRWSGDAARAAGVDLLAKADAPLGDWQPGPATAVEDGTPRRGAGHGPAVRQRQGPQAGGGVGDVRGARRVAAHTPDVCFLGSGYKLKNPPSKQTLPLAGGGSVEFYVADFEKTTATGTEAVRCRWAWTADGTWHAPDYPRLFFARSQLDLPVLYKLYVVHPIGDEDLTRNDPYRTLAADLAGTLGRQLAP